MCGSKTLAFPQLITPELLSHRRKRIILNMHGSASRRVQTLTAHLQLPETARQSSLRAEVNMTSWHVPQGCCDPVVVILFFVDLGQTDVT